MKIILSLILCLFALPALAASEQPEWLQSFLAEASPEAQRHFYMIYASHNLLGTVEMVKSDVTKTSQLCAKEHAEMAQELQMRFEMWDEEITTVLNEARGHINNMLIVQDYLPSEKISKLLAESDAKRAETLAQVDKVPLTTREACQHLHDTMDETQEKFIRLLRQTLISVPSEAQ